MSTILVADDERNIFQLTKLYLEKEGFRVLWAPDGKTALQSVASDRPDLLVLDIMLPELDGWEVCRRLRPAGNDIPIVMLTARDDDVDKVVGLELGADDYVTKPFNPRVLVARIKAVLRRAEVSPKAPEAVELGRLRLDAARREAWVGDKPIALRPKEFDLLWAFVQNRGLVLSRDQLLDSVWGYDYYGDTRTVDVHVASLRDKLEESGVVIETVWGIGYKMVAEEG